MSDPLPGFDAPGAPPAARAEFDALVAALDRGIPAKRDARRNLLIGTWNIKSFASLSEKWTAAEKDSPKRDFRAMWAIAEIVSRFDVIAIQEVMGDLKALRTLLKTLGRRWSFLMTDVTAGGAGNNERLAFLFDTSRIALSGLAGEIVVPPEWLDEIDEGALRRQFARTPYAVSFMAGRETFILTTLHVDYGKGASGRIPELRAIARWLADWAATTNRWHHNLIALGDFNIDRHDDALWQAFTSTGLTVPAQLNAVRRTIFADEANPRRDKYYDQIAWFVEGGDRQLDLVYKGAGGFDFVPFLYKDIGLTRQGLQYRLSDHYPLWTEFECRL